MKRILVVAALLVGSLLFLAPPSYAAPSQATPAAAPQPVAPQPAAPSAAQAQPLNSVVAVVNDDVITAVELAKRVHTVLMQLRQNNTPPPPLQLLRRQVLERLIVDRLQLTMAANKGIHVGDERLNTVIGRIAAQNKLTLDQFRAALAKEGVAFADFRNQIRDQILMNDLRQREVDSRVHVTPEEVDEFLTRNAGSSNLNVEYHLGHILISVPEGASPEQVQQARAKAEKVLGQLRSGTDFKQEAASYSDGQHALQGGDLGWRRWGQLPTEFANAVVTMAPGDVSDLIRTSSGFHIIKLYEKRGEKREMVTQTHARHILIRTNDITSDYDARTKLARLRDRILAGESFAELARANSQDPGSAAKGGDLGWVNPGSLVPAFEHVMDKLKPGEISEPFQTQFGWHIVQVLGRRQRDNTDELRHARAEEAIRQRKIEEATQDWLRRLRDEAYVEYHLNDN